MTIIPVISLYMYRVGKTDQGKNFLIKGSYSLCSSGYRILQRDGGLMECWDLALHLCFNHSNSSLFYWGQGSYTNASQKDAAAAAAAKKKLKSRNVVHNLHFIVGKRSRDITDLPEGTPLIWDQTETWN